MTKKSFAVASMFRNSQEWYGRQINQADRYFSQLSNQSIIPNEVLCIEGNSNDNTESVVKKYIDGLKGTIYCTFLKYEIDSDIKKAEKLIETSKIFEFAIKSMAQKYDYVIWLESDIIIEDTDFFQKLIEASEKTDYLIVAPFITIEKSDNIFYDTWATYGIDNVQWSNWPPYYTKFNSSNKYIEVQSTGTCLCIKSTCLKNKEVFIGEEGVKSFCHAINNEQKNRIAIANDIRAQHPAMIGNLKGRWV